MLSLPTLALLAVANPSVVHAELRAEGRVLFTLEKTHTETADGTLQVRSVYRDPKGVEALVMEATLQNDRPIEVRADDRQGKTRGVVKMRPGRVEFERTDATGEVERESVDVNGIVMVGPGLTRYLQSDEAWKRLERGEKVRLQIAAWERMGTYPFDLMVVGGDEETVQVIMRPGSWVVRAFVDEMRYTFERRTRRLKRYRGPVGVKKVEDDGSLSALVAEVVYE